jgi:hypothetical protein
VLIVQHLDEADQVNVNWTLWPGHDEQVLEFCQELQLCMFYLIIGDTSHYN